MAIGSTPLGNMAIEVNLDDTRLRQTTTNMKALMKSVNAEFQANMSAVKRTGSEMDILATRTQGLTKKYEVQKKTVESLQEAYEKARIEAEKQGATQTQIRAMESKRQALNKEKASLNDLESALQSAQKEQSEMIANNKRLESSFGKLDTTIKATGDKLKGIGSGLSGVGQSMSMAITAPLLGIGATAVKTAGEYEASASQFKQVFGELEGQATNTLDSISKTTGLLPNSLKDSFTSITAFAKTTGSDTADALDIGKRAMLASADSAAFYDKSIEEVTESLQSYLKGNYENDSALGISSTETTRNAKANELYSKSFNDLSESQKQLTLLAMVEDGNKLSGALGQASRESNTLNTQTANLKTAFKDFLAEIGKPILPIAVNMFKSLSGVVKTGAETFNRMSGTGKAVALAVAGIIAILPPLLVGIGLISTGLGSVMAMGAPLFLTITGIVAGLGLLGIGFVKAYKHSQTFRNVVHGALEGVKKAFNTAKGVIKGVFQLFQGDGTQGVITLSKFISPTLVVGLTKTVGTIKSTIVSMSNAVKKVFTDIGKEISIFWKQNGKMITQALSNMMAIVRPILSALKKLFGTVFKVTFVVAKTIVVETFKAIVGVIKGAIKVITGIIQVFSALFTGNWKKLFQGLWKIAKGLIEIIWNGINLMFFGRIIKGGLAFAKGFTKIFPALWKGIKKVFTDYPNAIYKFVTKLWGSLAKKSSETLSAMYKGISKILSNLYKGFKNIFNDIWDKTKSIFKAIFEYVPKKINDTKKGALDGLKAMKKGMDNLMDSMKEKVTDTFSDMVDGAKALPKKLGDGISNGKDKAVQGVRNLGNSMVGKLGGVVNSTIGGINTITGKLGIDKKISEWNVPKFSTGTRNGALANDSLITVGDKGKGNWKGVRELVQFPNGSMSLFNKETTFHAPKGTKVFSNYETEHMLGTPYKFSTGTGGTISSFFSKFGSTIAKGFGDVMDFIDNPASLVDKLIGSVTKRFGFDGLSNFALDFAKGGFNQIKKAVKGFIDKMFSEYAVSNADGGEILSFHKTTPYSPNSRPPGYPFPANHYGIDLATPVGTLLHAPTSGTLSQVHDTNGGLVAILKDKLYTQFFMHLSKVLKSGMVKQGEAIVRTGNSGAWTTGAHLHYQVRKNDGTNNWNTNTIDPEKFLRNRAPKSTGKGTDGTWTGTVKKALALSGLPQASSYVGAWLRQIQSESGGNPTAVQHGYVDVNTGGNEARGLVQVIPPTFNAFKLPGHGNIMNPLDNLIAGMRYAKARYGSSMLSVIGHGHGYRTGGLVFGKQLAWLDEDNKGEAVIPFDPARRADAMKLLAYTAQRIMPKEKGGRGYKPSSLPDIKTDNSESKMIELMLKMIQKQDEQIEELKKQTKAIQDDRYTVVEANGREIAKVTHEYHDDLNARKQNFQPRTVI